MTATTARPDAPSGAASSGAADGNAKLGFWRSLRPSGRELAGAVAGGLAFAAAFPPIPGVLLIFVCLVPIAVGVARAADSGAPARVAARLGVWFTVVGFGLALYWIAVALSLFTPLAFLAYIGTIIGMSALVALTTTSLFVARRLTKWPLAILLPAAWVSLEILLAYFSDLAFPWFPLGLAVARHPAWAQAADLSGVHGLSVWIAATNGLLADAWLAAKPSAGAAAAARMAAGDPPPRGDRAARGHPLLAAAVRGYGAWRLHTTVLEPLARIGIVQPNISEDEKMQRAMQGRFIVPLAALTRQEEARDHPVLMLWPETALPDFLDTSAGLDGFAALARARRVDADPVRDARLHGLWSRSG